ncbi:MAG: N-acetylmuramoyl-L-alanine amidase [Gemmatimonadota bacterium]
MIALLGILLLSEGGPPPATLTITTPRGEARIAVRYTRLGAPVLAAPILVAALNGVLALHQPWADVTVARQSFRFLLDAPYYLYQGTVQPMAGAASMSTDTVFLPYEFVAEILPRVFAERYRFDQDDSHLVETGPLVATRPVVPPAQGRLPNGLLPGHLVTVDAGHGGTDPGNPGLYFPRGVTEKDVTLQVARILRTELIKRGIQVRMTRTTDTLIALGDRGGYCTASCDLFVSLHVNSLARARGYTTRRGFETYFLAEAKTEDAERVARMENEAIRFENHAVESASGSGLDFILRDLQLNEYLRESARLAELIQENLDPVHSGQNRGVKQAGFRVLTSARRPAVLVELGYSTNPEDARLMAVRTGQESLASAIADAVVAYLLEYERKIGPGGK